MRNNARSIEKFLASDQAVQGLFARLGWDKHRRIDGAEFYLLANYGILEDMEMDIDVQGDTVGVQLYIPQVREDLRPQAKRLIEAFDALDTPLAVLTVSDGYVVGTACDMASFERVWAAYDDPQVYEIILTLCSLTDVPAPSEFAPLPDNPFEETI